MCLTGTIDRLLAVAERISEIMFKVFVHIRRILRHTDLLFKDNQFRIY